ncbi:MAG: nucleotidyltransferase domain-containing protein [Defluviitaleaceae bacterium]|nr:nucleotidyltransferase domain-containing protein [Defluviitaleaceae bacterium]
MLTIDEIKKKFSPIFTANNVKQAILFGSHATHTARPVSDIDVVVDVDEEIDALDFFGMKAELENSFNMPVDLIAKFEIQPASKIDCEIKEKGILIYGET